MLCVPALRPLVGHAAVRVLPAPVSASAPQPLMVLPPSVKFRVPVGPLPVTDAVNVTPVPTVDGFAELTSAVVVAVPPPGADTDNVRALAVAEITLTLIPYVLSVYVCPTSSAASPKLPGVPSVMSSISVSSMPLVNCSGEATRICAPLFGYPDIGRSNPMGWRYSSQ